MHWYSVVQVRADQLVKDMQDQNCGFLGSIHMEVEQAVSHTGERRPWTTEEDQMLLQSVKELGSANWTAVARNLKGRQPKQCRQRYFNKVMAAPVPSLASHLGVSHADSPLCCRLILR